MLYSDKKGWEFIYNLVVEKESSILSVTRLLEVTILRKDIVLLGFSNTKHLNIKAYEGSFTTSLYVRLKKLYYITLKIEE